MKISSLPKQTRDSIKDELSYIGLNNREIKNTMNLSVAELNELIQYDILAAI